MRAHLKGKIEGTAEVVSLAISRAGAEELDGVERAAAAALLLRRRELGLSDGGGGGGSRVVGARPCADGWLQAEVRTYRRKDGGSTERGPYWYFRYHDAGRQKKLYLGRTDDPEGRLREKRAARRGGRAGRGGAKGGTDDGQGQLDLD